jgi:rhamnose utilization protein RhaD (predicted bifunctional aldolase and dehydrogenase)
MEEVGWWFNEVPCQGRGEGKKEKYREKVRVAGQETRRTEAHAGGATSICRGSEKHGREVKVLIAKVSPWCSGRPVT